MKRWLAREGALLLGGVIVAFLFWIPIVINVLPRLFGRQPDYSSWGFEHLPEFFGSMGAYHAVMSWTVALIPYFTVQLARTINWSVWMYLARRSARKMAVSAPEEASTPRPDHESGLVGSQGATKLAPPDAPDS